MGNIYRTARGSQIDLQKLKLMNETVVAVGNANQNARGDIVSKGRIVKTREQLAQEHYNISGNNIVKEVKVKRSMADVEPDHVQEPLNFENVYDSLSNNSTTEDIAQKPLDNAPRGGMADAVTRSKELAERLAAQRRRI